MSRVLRLAFAIPVAHAAACSAFGADPARTGGSDAGSAVVDASSPPSEASVPSAPSTPSTPSTPVIADGGTEVSLLNGDFELGCAAWAATGDLAESATARTGKGACRVCAAVNNGFVSLTQTTNVTVTAGSLFTAEIWYRADPTEPASEAPFAILHTYASSYGLATENGPASTGKIPTADWVKVTALLKPTKAASALQFELSFQQSPGKCILVDDASIVRTP